MKNKIKDFEKIINYNFKKKRLLEKALTTKSYDNENNNEKLEVLESNKDFEQLILDKIRNN